MDVDAFFLLMKGGIPAQVIRMDFEGASNVTDVRIDQRLPVGGVIITQSLCVFPAQCDHRRPHITGMLRHLPDCSREIMHLPTRVPQAVFTRQLDAGSMSNVVQEVFPLIQGLHEALSHLTDELIGSFSRWLIPVVVILQQVLSLWEGAEETPDICLLFFRGRESAVLICQQLHSLSCGDISHPVSEMRRIPTALEIGRDQYDPCHVPSSSNRRCRSSASSKLI